MAAAAPIDIGTLIVSTPGIVGGSPRIAGTRLSVKAVAELYNAGWSAERIADDRPAAGLNQIHAAIAYYLTNKQAIDDEIAADDEFIRQEMAAHPESLHCADDSSA
jgi:uncharacterized protein (DUF433 family)